MRGSIVKNYSICYFLAFLFIFSLADLLGDDQPGVHAQFMPLKKLQSSMLWLESEVSRLNEQLREETREANKAKWRDQIFGLQKKQTKLRQQFIEIAAGVEIEEDIRGQQEPSKDFVKELQNILTPLLDNLRRVSKRPREISSLKSEIGEIEGLLPARILALSRIEKRFSDPQYDLLRAKLESAIKHLEREIKGLQIELDTKRRRLEKLAGNKKPIWETVKEYFLIFFKTKGINILIFLLALGTTFWFSVIFRHKLFQLAIFRGRLKALDKTLQALYNTMAVVLCFFFALFCLYLLNDWMLVTLFAFLVMGVVITSRQVIPQFLNETKLILNLGTVREGERLIWGGVSWKITKLGFYSHLVNPNLQGGEIIISAKELLNYVSRPIVAGEIWFPTYVGDWISIEGGNIGKVLSQTPDHVLVQFKGAGKKYYGITDYIALQPQNLSMGFEVECIVPLDFIHQKEVLATLIPMFKSAFVTKMQNFQDIYTYIQNIEIRFHSVSEEFMHLWINLSCEGFLAPEAYHLKMTISEVFVAVCNDADISIPCYSFAASFEESFLQDKKLRQGGPKID